MLLEQLAVLKDRICNAKNRSDLAKQILMFLIEASEGVTKETRLTLVADREGYTADEIRRAAIDFDQIQKSGPGLNGLNQILADQGSNLCFSALYGHFDQINLVRTFIDEQYYFDCGQKRLFRGNLPLRYTFWFAIDCYSRQATLVCATRNQLEQIPLKGLTNI